MPNYKRLFIPNAYLFITIATYGRKPILIDNIDVLRDAFKRTKKNYDFEIYASVILPEHMHLILLPQNIEEYPKIIRSIKYYFSRNINHINIDLSKSKLRKGEKGIWQRRYWEHTIRDEDDLYKHLNYIHFNPIKHKYAQAAKDWEFSSFSKFVKMNFYEPDWYCEENFEEVLAMELE